MSKPTPSSDHNTPKRSAARTREIVVAAGLTVAALGFIAAALLRSDSAQRTPGVETARKPATN
jgi:hypothetical protein